MKKNVLLSTMMFLQFMMLPVWFVPMFPYVKAMEGGGSWALWCGMIMGFGTLTSPLFGMLADRFLNAERVLAICNFLCAGLLGGAFLADRPSVLFVILLGVMCVYMPTWALTATIAMANASRAAFPRIRVFGTLGWVASGVFSFLGTRLFGIADFDSTPWIFAGGALAAGLGGLLALILPPTPPAARGSRMSVVDALGLRAFVLFRKPVFVAFAVLMFLAMIPFQWYNVYCAAYLKESGFEYLTLTLNLGQAGEIGFMLLVPVLIRRFGYRKAMILAIGALAFRYVCFFISSAFGLAAFDFGGILVHGLIFGLLIVGSQMFVDDVAPAPLRNQAQGLVTLLTAGLGVFASNACFDRLVARTGWTVSYAVATAMAVLVAILMGCFFRVPPKSGGNML